MRTRTLIPLRAAVMVFLLIGVLPVGAEEIVVTKEMKEAVRKQEESVQKDMDDFEAMGIYCTLKKRGLQKDPRYSAFFSHYHENFKHVICGEWDK